MALIRYYEINEISRLKESWLVLQNGQDMTYFQQYAWYESISERMGKLNGKKFHAIFAVLEKNCKISIIAPLWIVKESFYIYKKGIYFFAGSPYPDYLNFIYDKLVIDDVLELLYSVSEKYDVWDYSFEELKFPSLLYSCLIRNMNVVYERDSVCVHIDIKKNNDYYKSLSKNTRQNIRTALNRAQKDGVEFVFTSDDHNISASEFAKYRRLRHKEKGYLLKVTWKSRIKRILRRLLFPQSFFEFKKWMPWRDDKNTHFMTLRTKEGKLCAAFNYGIDPLSNSIVIMTVCTNPAFLKYSPGMITMYKYILEQISIGGVCTVDFTRGNEPYKYHLGGEDHYNKILSFIINKQK